jgi:hypothetical protein
MSIGNLILTFLMAIPLGQETANIRVRIILFEVPSMIVSRVIAGEVAEGEGVVGTMVGGSTTGSFPDEAVTLQNRLAAGSDTMDIKRVIREFMAYDCIKAQDVSVFELTEHELVFNYQNEAGQEVAEELDLDSLLYRLDIEPVWKNDEEAGLALRVWLRWQDPYGIQDIRDNIPERLVFDQTVLVKFSQVTFVGFPSSTSKSRRSIYWLALSVEKLCR